MEEPSASHAQISGVLGVSGTVRAQVAAPPASTNEPARAIIATRPPVFQQSYSQCSINEHTSPPLAHPRGGGTGRKLRRTHGENNDGAEEFDVGVGAVQSRGAHEAHTTGTQEHHHYLRGHRNAGEAAARNDEPQMTAMGHAATARHRHGLGMTASGRGEAGDSITIAAAGGGLRNQNSSHHLEHQRSTQAPGGLRDFRGSDGGGEVGGIVAASNAPGRSGFHPAAAVSQLASVGMGEARMGVDVDREAHKNEQEEVGQAEVIESDAARAVAHDLCGETRGEGMPAASEQQNVNLNQQPPAMPARKLRARASLKKVKAVGPPSSAPEGVVTRGRGKGSKRATRKGDQLDGLDGGEDNLEATDRPAELKRKRGGRQPRDAKQHKEDNGGGEAEGGDANEAIGELKAARASTPMSRANSNQGAIDQDLDPQASVVVSPMLQSHHSLLPQLSTGGGRPAQSAIAASGAHPVPATNAPGNPSHFHLVSVATDVRQGFTSA